MLLKPENCYVSHQFYVVFDYESYKVPLMREGTIPPNWKDFVQISSQSGVPDNIGIRDDCLTPYIEEDPRETPTHVPRLAPENNRNIITSL